MPSWPSGKVLSATEKEEVIQEYLKTPDRRGVLAASTIHPSQEMLALLANGPWSTESLTRVERMIGNMERIQSHFTGGEYGFDNEEFQRLLVNLRGLAKVIATELNRPPPRTSWDRVLDDDPV